MDDGPGITIRDAAVAVARLDLAFDNGLNVCKYAVLALGEKRGIEFQPKAFA